MSRGLDISQERVTGVLDRWLTTEVTWEQFDRIEILAIDEIALKRGHCDYVTVVATPLDPEGVGVLAVLADRQKETVAKFFDSIPIRLKVAIKRVCTDMHHGVVGATREQLPRAKIVVVHCSTIHQNSNKPIDFERN